MDFDVRVRPDIGHGVRAIALGLALSACGVTAAERSVASEAATIAALDAALHRGASVEAMTLLLSEVDGNVLQQWMIEETGHTKDCRAPDWLVALHASLAIVTPERTAALLAIILRHAEPEMYGCFLRESYAELGFTGRDGYPLLADAIRRAGILDTLGGGTADDALITEVLDTVLAPGALPYNGIDPPFLNPLEREPAASSS